MPIVWMTGFEKNQRAFEFSGKILIVIIEFIKLARSMAESRVLQFQIFEKLCY
jgi:hypothetical protein